MLTPIDIHYLVGLLSQASHPDNVEIELGNYVFDEASASSRDVDVTVTVRQDAKVTAFKGLEVKAHTRKLGSEGVEQLVAKLNDMPSITDKAIVSASGFTAPAVRKAKKHGVKLYELRRWNPAEGFDYFKCESVPMVMSDYHWIGSPHIRLNTRGNNGVTITDVLGPEVSVVSGEGGAGGKGPIRQWLQQLHSRAAQEAEKHISPPTDFGVGTHRKSVSATLEFSDKPRIEGSFGSLDVTSAEVSGVLEVRIQALSSEYKALFSLDEPTPIVGCAVSEAGPLGLLGLIVNSDRELRFLQVPIAARNKAKIFREKLAQSPAAPIELNIGLNVIGSS